MPHLEHTTLLVVATGVIFGTVIAGLYMEIWSNSHNDTVCEIKRLPLHAWMPSAHVWPKFSSTSSPQSLNQSPPGEQQLALPDFLDVPQLEHTALFVVVTDVLVAAEVAGLHGRI